MSTAASIFDRTLSTNTSEDNSKKKTNRRTRNLHRIPEKMLPSKDMKSDGEEAGLSDSKESWSVDMWFYI
jgi:hypothetical protein